MHVQVVLANLAFGIALAGVIYEFMECGCERIRMNALFALPGKCAVVAIETHPHLVLPLAAALSGKTKTKVKFGF